MLFGKFIARTNEMDLQGNTLVHEIENLKPLVFKSFINFISSYNIYNIPRNRFNKYEKWLPYDKYESIQ